MREEYGGQAHLGEAQRGRAGRSLALASALTLGAVTAVLCAPAFGAWVNAPLHH